MMLHPNFRNPEVSCSQTGPLAQDLGVDPDGSPDKCGWPAHMPAQSPLPQCCASDKASGLRVWAV